MVESPPPPTSAPDSTAQTPSSLIILDRPSSYQPQPPPLPQPSLPPPLGRPPTEKAAEKHPFGLFSLRRPPIRVTTEFDSDSLIFFHKVSSKLFDGLAKLKFTFQNNGKGDIADPQVALITKHLAIHYDVEEQNALVKGFVNVGPNLQLCAAHDVKAQQGEVTMAANLADPAYKFELASAVPSMGVPKATLRFPAGEVSLEEKEDEELKRILSINGMVKGSIMNGVATALYKDGSLNLRYSYKVDEEMSFIPSISLPSNALSFAFKRQFGPSDKLSYWYNFDSNYWSTVYKHTVGKDYKFKAGYDSEVRLGWASLWVGDDGGKAKTAPMKMKIQFMLQVPQDDIKSSILLFRVKKRWDI
ncbi:Outer envelope pore protein 37, chloroplastic, variant 2 [Ancistrocladus abbreviatus]